MVTAVMKTKLDPYTGAQLTGPLTNAVGYFNATTCHRYRYCSARHAQLVQPVWVVMGIMRLKASRQAFTICMLAQPDTPPPSSPRTFKS